ncbi:MAG: DNA adenine methylase [Spirochaetia bacterium]|nr:DNA adenine methylase [Spirochaetia bacterium]
MKIHLSSISPSDFVPTPIKSIAITPLRYMGSKNKKVIQFYEMFPPAFKRYFEPFLGGGSVALFISQKRNVPIFVNDIDQYLSFFWKSLIKEPDSIIQEFQKAKNQMCSRQRLWKTFFLVDKRNHV